MPSDAKFGLVVGMILVLLIALLFFRREGTGELPAAQPAPTKALPPPPKVEPKIAVPRIEPPPQIDPPPAPDDIPELPPPAFGAPPLPTSTLTKM